MRLGIHSIAHAAMIVLIAGQMSARADTQTWNTATGDWSEVANWTTAVPADGDDVIITNRGAFVLLTNSTPWLSSMTISNASLICSNWDTTIYVTNLTILNSGILTCAGPFTNTAMSNRVNVTCTNLLFIASNGAINVQAKGFQGGVGPGYGLGSGPGGIASGYSIRSAGHGGMGVYGQIFDIPSNTYDSIMAPIYPGSGGAGGNTAGQWGGHGGGAVCITAGQVVVNGRINADATPEPIAGAHNSGGSGGSVYITCITITGTNGFITANGGNACLSGANMLGGGGGGGRIAVIYDTVSESAIAPGSSIRCSVAPGMSGRAAVIPCGEPGTLYFPDSVLFSPTNLCTGRWLAPGFPAELSLSDWTISNVWLRIPGTKVTVTNTLSISGTNYSLCRLEMTNAGTIACGNLLVGGATLCMGSFGYPFLPSWMVMNGGASGSTVNCAGDLVLTNAARFYIYAGETNAGSAAEYGARVSVGNEVRILTNCWIYPAAHPTNGAVPLFSMRTLTVDQGGGFNANALGYAGGLPDYSEAYGPSQAPSSAGAGYGGAGSVGYSSPTAGVIYGSSNAPTAPGSGARGRANDNKTVAYGAYGGGSVQIRAADIVTFQGTITANGAYGASPNGGGSSGGGIYITCRTFVGTSNGVLQANGGAGNQSSVNGGGGGGGGRIAVWRIFDRSTSAISNSVSGAIGRPATVYQNTSDPGTIVWGWLVPPRGSIVSVY